MKRRIIVPAVLSLLCCLSQAYGHEMPDGAPPLAKSETCGGCHVAIYGEWQESFHAASSALKDQAHNALRQAFVKAMTAQGKQGNYHCANCHAPMSDNLADLMSGKAELDSANWTQAEGVGCTFCHRIEAVVDQKNFNQYRLNQDGAFLTSRPANLKAAHKTAQSPLFADGQVCMGCHSHYINAKDAPVCVMNDEGKGNCISCHMPQTAGGPALGSSAATHRSHKMLGGHDLDMLKKAVTLDAAIKAEGTQQVVSIAVKNIIEHTFPSTNPMRMAFVKVTGKDKTGNAVWTNFKDSPLEDKNALFFKAFKAGDKVGVPSWEAEAVAFDTRLKAGETRSITYSIDNPSLAEVDVELIYMLFPPSAIDAFAIPKDGVNEKPHSVAKKVLTIGGQTTGDCWKKETQQLTVSYYTKSTQCDDQNNVPPPAVVTVKHHKNKGYNKQVW